MSTYVNQKLIPNTRTLLKQKNNDIPLHFGQTRENLYF